LRAAVFALSLCLLPLSSALAHTTVKLQQTEGVRDDNALRIGHGCEGDRDVIAQSVVFPTDAPVLSLDDPNAVVPELADVITQGSLAGLAQSIQDRSIFDLQTEIVDENRNVVGFQARKGRLSHELVGRVPFQFTPPTFVAESCAARLLIKIAIADICSVKKPVLDPTKLSLWIPDNGSAIATAALAAGVEGIGGAATLTVNRNLLANPLAEGCGAGFDVTVTPSAAQVDRDLPIPKYWQPR
jgi:hypothetical protein